jgi:nitric oxide synthase-interacting protein
MPARKSVRNSSRGFFTSEEKKTCGYGEKKARVGSDGQTPFGYCTLSLQPAVDPVVSPSGHIYSRESIYEYLLTKKEDIGRQKVSYEAQQKVLQEQEQKTGPEAVAVNKFVESQNALSASISLKRKRKQSEIDEER